MNIIKTETFNNRNGWGMGDAGTIYTYDNGVCKIDTQTQHRHTGTSRQKSYKYFSGGDWIKVLGFQDTSKIFIFERKYVKHGSWGEMFNIAVMGETIEEVLKLINSHGNNKVAGMLVEFRLNETIDIKNK